MSGNLHHNISIVIITYNRPQLLRQCLPLLIEQDYPKEKYEIVIVDDGGAVCVEDLAAAATPRPVGCAAQIIDIKETGECKRIE